MTTYIYRLPSLVEPLGSTLYLFGQLRSSGSVGDRYTLMENLEIGGIFEDETKEEGDSVTNALSIMLRLLGEELEAAS